MSYKHNNLMAMRHRFWDESSDHVLNEKQFLQQTLIEQGIFNNATLMMLSTFSIHCLASLL